MKRFSFLAAITALASLWFMPSSLLAQQGGGNNQAQATPSPTPGPARTPFPLWKAELPGGNYIIARNAINAVSSQEYILDGVARVTEVNVTTTGGVFQPRFYYLEMLASKIGDTALPGAQLAQHALDVAQDAGTQATQVAPDGPWTKVVKNYPTTTHAGTIEFRLDTKEELQALYASVERVWLTGKSEVYTVAGTRPFNVNDELKALTPDTNNNATGSPGSGTAPGGTGSGNN